MGKSYHLCLSVRGFLTNTKFPREYEGVFTHDDGRSMTPTEARDMLFDQIKLGREVIPFGTCDNFDWAGGGCLGHDETPTNREEPHG